MRIATIIVLGIIALLLLHIANELRKGKTVVLFFGKDRGQIEGLQVSTPTGVNTQIQTPASNPIQAANNFIDQVSNTYDLNVAYGKSVLNQITGGGYGISTRRG